MSCLIMAMIACFVNGNDCLFCQAENHYFQPDAGESHHRPATPVADRQVDVEHEARHGIPESSAQTVELARILAHELFHLQAQQYCQETGDIHFQ